MLSPAKVRLCVTVRGGSDAVLSPAVCYSEGVGLTLCVTECTREGVGFRNCFSYASMLTVPLGSATQCLCQST